MNFGVTVSAEQFEIFEAQRNRRIRQILRRQMYFVMNALARRIKSASETALAEAAARRNESAPTFLPRGRAIEIIRKLLMHFDHQMKTSEAGKPRSQIFSISIRPGFPGVKYDTWPPAGLPRRPTERL